MPGSPTPHRIEHVPEPNPPRVRLNFPGDAPARLRRWRQDQNGQWWAELTVYAPAGAVRRVSGEDYAAVPRIPAGTGCVVQTLPSGQLVLHRADCWAAGGRTTPVPPGTEKSALKFSDTEPCEICRPQP